MSNATRQMLFFGAMVIFVCVITLTLFFGSGYRINWRSGDISVTSGITVVTLPKTATVTLGPNAETKTSPARFTQLAPGEYVITIAADGYYSQTLTVDLTEQAAIQFDPVQLWPVSNSPIPSLTRLDVTLTETTMLNNQLATVYKNPTTGQWLLQQTNALYIYDPQTNHTTTLVRLAEPITAVAWHGNNWYVLYSTPSQLHIIDTRTAYATNDTILAMVDNITAIDCAHDGLSCRYMAKDQTYTLSLR